MRQYVSRHSHDFGNHRIFAEWNMVDSLWEHEQGMAIDFGGSVYLIPKRAIESPQQLRDFTTSLFSYFGRPITPGYESALRFW